MSTTNAFVPQPVKGPPEDQNILQASARLLTNIVMVFYFIVEAFVLKFVPSKFRFKSVKDEIVLVTGAGSGIGRLMANKFADLGAKVICWDINKDGMEETVNDIKSKLMIFLGRRFLDSIDRVFGVLHAFVRVTEFPLYRLFIIPSGEEVPRSSFYGSVMTQLLAESSPRYDIDCQARKSEAGISVKPESRVVLSQKIGESLILFTFSQTSCDTPVYRLIQ